MHGDSTIPDSAQCSYEAVGGAGGGRGEGGKQGKEREWKERESGRRRIITCQPDDLTSNERGYVTICKVFK